MGVPQQDALVLCPQAAQLRRQGIVIGPPEGGDAARDLALIRLLARQIDGFVVEGGQGAKPGVVGPGIERRAVRRAVEVDDIARMGGCHRRRPAGGGETVEAIDMPVGVGQAAGQRGHGVGDGGGKPGAGMGNGDDERRAAALHGDGFHAAPPSLCMGCRTRRCATRMRSRWNGIATGSLASQRCTMLS